ncbi:thiamine phosphate synthase [Joostella sp. CR20]|uniref:thiamine phosphate synthase n=1 Tax=Joostella sp. CR20 TaxID=2804312 RepID=UPI00313D9865
MLIVITNEEKIANEIETIENLFQNGLQTLHVRKPTFSKVELKNWLQLLNEKYHDKLMLHQHHELATDFNVKGVHLTEKHRKKVENISEYVKNYQKMKKIVSASFHSVSALKAEASVYDYVFLSPVFTSVSKENYHGKQFIVTDLKTKTIALGGITSATISEVKKMGYHGVAILGSVWKSATPIISFIELQTEYKSVFYDE